MTFQECLSASGRVEVKLYLLVRSVVRVIIARDKVSVDPAQNVSQIVGVRTIGSLLVPQLEWLAGFLHKIHELVDLKQRNERVHGSREILSHKSKKRGTSNRHVRRLLLLHQ